MTEILQQQKLFGVAAPLMKDQLLAVAERKRLVEIYKKQVEPIWKGLNYKFEVNANGDIHFHANSAAISDLSPIAGMRIDTMNLVDLPIASIESLANTPLKYLNINQCKVLTTLKGLPIERLHTFHVDNCFSLDDISAIRGASLSYISLRASPKLAKIEALRGIPLRGISLKGLAVADLSPLEKAPLEEVYLGHLQIHDLSPLQMTKLKRLTISHCNSITSLEPLHGDQLERVDVGASRIASLAPLVRSPLLEVSFDPMRIVDPDALLRIPTLERVTAQNRIFTRDEFAKHLQAGGFKKKK